MNSKELAEQYEACIGQEIVLETKAGMFYGVFKQMLVCDEVNSIVIIKIETQEYRINSKNIISLKLK